MPALTLYKMTDWMLDTVDFPVFMKMVELKKKMAFISSI